MELQEYLRSLAIDNLFSNLDSYTGSARNYYLYHNLTSDRWHWVKWDGNESFGSYSNGVSDPVSLATNYHEDDRPLIERIFDIPGLYSQYLEEMCYVADNYFNSGYINDRIDELKTLIEESVYADDNKMYTDTEFDTNIESSITSGGGPMGGTVYGLKSFVSSKYSVIVDQLVCTSKVNERGVDGFSAYPNPCGSILMVESLDKKMEKVSVISPLGQQVVIVISTGSLMKAEVDLSQVPEGWYLIKVDFEDGSFNCLKSLVKRY